MRLSAMTSSVIAKSGKYGGAGQSRHHRPQKNKPPPPVQETAARPARPQAAATSHDRAEELASRHGAEQHGQKKDMEQRREIGRGSGQDHMQNQGRGQASCAAQEIPHRPSLPPARSFLAPSRRTASWLKPRKLKWG